jgi:predicted RNA-binding Zn ribbon-like protein
VKAATLSARTLRRRLLIRFRLRLAYLTLAVWLAEHVTWRLRRHKPHGYLQDAVLEQMLSLTSDEALELAWRFAFDEPPTDAAPDYLEAREELREVILGVLTFRATGALGNTDETNALLLLAQAKGHPIHGEDGPTDDDEED